MALTLIVNGQPRTFETLSKTASLEELIGELGLKGDRVAIELNGEIVPRAGWAATALKSGDRLEVVHFVGGGCVGLAGGKRAGVFRAEIERSRARPYLPS